MVSFDLVVFNIHFTGLPKHYADCRELSNYFHDLTAGNPAVYTATKSLTTHEERGLKRLLEKYTYSCGSMITPDGIIIIINIASLLGSCQGP